MRPPRPPRNPSPSRPDTRPAARAQHGARPSAGGPPGAKPPGPEASGAKPPGARPHTPRPPQRREREREPDRLLFGLHAVRAAWLNPERVCRRLLCTEAGREALAGTLAESAAQGFDRPAPESVERERLDRMVPPGAVHQGVVLEAEPLPALDLDDLGRAASLRDTAAVMVLDQVTDPHNVGAILRSAAAFGALGVIVTERHAPEITGTLAKAASGAVEHVPLVRVTNLARALLSLREWGFAALGLDEEAERTLADTRLPPRVALVLGAEGTGLRRLTRDTCNLLARLPTTGPIASLNVSNAAAVALYELARRRDAADPAGAAGSGGFLGPTGEAGNDAGDEA